MSTPSLANDNGCESPIDARDFFEECDLGGISHLLLRKEICMQKLNRRPLQALQMKNCFTKLRTGEMGVQSLSFLRSQTGFRPHVSHQANSSLPTLFSLVCRFWDGWEF